MDKDDKILENAAIKIRNRKKGKIRLTLSSGPQPSTQPPSDDESLIMVSSTHSKSGKSAKASPSAAFMNKLKNVFSPIFKNSKHSAQDDTADESHEQCLKRLRQDAELEIDMAVGDVFIPVHSDEILELEAEREYIPLTLFTPDGTTVLSDHLHDIRQKKINSNKKR